MCIIESNASSSRADFLMILRIIIEFRNDILISRVSPYKKMTKQRAKLPLDMPIAFQIGHEKPDDRIQEQRRTTNREQFRVRS